MRKFVYLLMTSLAIALVGCVTINVYFPEAAAQKAADQFIGNVLDDSSQATAPPSKDPKPAPPASHPPSAMLLDLLIPAAQAADTTPNLRIQTSTTEAIRNRMQARIRGALGALLDSGAAGFTSDGMVAMRDASKVALNQRTQANATLADENRDRAALYAEVANANNHPEWAPQIRATFAKGWIDKARAGWYYQNAAGAWQRK
ncbi:YdbL family protein [Rhodanobacter sp. L36]|uniref:YdbL family protein n=1 Tax=Rhodanobacter sp. L36 TaxID=1747221 RepID=UPI00131B4795|nr:YdbL family protein [Rhodanobacter sp. L36]